MSGILEFAQIAMTHLSLLLLLCCHVAALSYKAAIDLELKKSKEAFSTFFPNEIEVPIGLDAQREPHLAISVKLEEKESLQVLQAEQVVLTLASGLDRKSFLLPRKGPLYTLDLVN